MVKVAIREPHPLVLWVRSRNRGKGGFYRVGGSQMRPVLGWEVIKSKQPFFVFFQAVGRFWVLGLVTGDELIIGFQSSFSGGR
jgi:hypothetical protein